MRCDSALYFGMQVPVFGRNLLFLSSMSLKIETAGPSEALIPICQTTQRCILDYSYVQFNISPCRFSRLTITLRRVQMYYNL
jgi:hypothetical protein